MPGVQRLTTPPLPAEKDIAKDEREAVYRHHLILLRAQIKLHVEKDNQDALFASVDSTIGDLRKDPQSVTSEQIAKLTADVNKSSQNASPNVGVQPESLEGKETKDFENAIRHAMRMSEKLRGDDDALDKVFVSTDDRSWAGKLWGSDPTTRKQAKQNLNLIETQLDSWSKNVDTLVRITRTEAGFGASATGQVLTLSPTFLTSGEDNGRGATLVHEASHSAVMTRDLAYIGAPYFFRLKDELALNNADHYAFAVGVTAGTREQPVNAGQGAHADADIGTFDSARMLAWLRADKAWAAAMWLKSTYTNPETQYADPKAVPKHARLMGLQVGDKMPPYAVGKPTVADDEPRRHEPLRQANAELMVQLYRSAKIFLNKEMDFVKDPNDSSITMKPKDGSKPIEVENAVGKSIDELSKVILRAFGTVLGLPSGPGWDPTEIGEWLSRHYFKSKESRYGDRRMEAKLLDILKAG